MDDLAIKVHKVKKNFSLPQEKTTSIKTGIVRIFKEKNKFITIQKALRGVSFDIKKGEFFGILGRNGSGKSTLLKILAEIYRPTDGEVSVDGKLVPFIELGVGFNPDLTGRENVYLNGALFGFSRKEIDARYDDIVAFAELEEFMDQKLKNYSSGMQVRLAFSVATRAEADILLVDEVLAVGDADFQRKCFDYFHSLKRSHKTVVFVTHDMNAVREYCDRAVLIENGEVAFAGEARDVANEYLKLFNTSQPSDEEPDSKRWGSGELKLVDSRVTFENTLDISLSIKSQKVIRDAVVEVRIYNGQGDVAAVLTNNQNKQKKLHFKEAERKTVHFKSENILSPGEYRVGYTISLTDNVTIFDANDDLITVNNNEGTTSGYSVVLPSDITVEPGVS